MTWTFICLERGKGVQNRARLDAKGKRIRRSRNQVMGDLANLPAGLDGKARNLHPEWSTPRTRSSTLLVSKVLIATGATGKLNDQTFPHEVRAIYLMLDISMETSRQRESDTYGKLTTVLAISSSYSVDGG